MRIWLFKALTTVIISFKYHLIKCDISFLLQVKIFLIPVKTTDILLQYVNGTKVSTGCIWYCNFSSDGRLLCLKASDNRSDMHQPRSGRNVIFSVFSSLIHFLQGQKARLWLKRLTNSLPTIIFSSMVIKSKHNGMLLILFILMR